MSQEKYLNNYVDLLKNTLNDQVARNLQMQANLKTQEEIMGEMSTQLQSTLQQLQEKQTGSNEVVVQREQELLQSYNNDLSNLQASYNAYIEGINQNYSEQFQKAQNEYENLLLQYNELKSKNENIEENEIEANKKKLEAYKKELELLNKYIEFYEKNNNELVQDLQKNSKIFEEFKKTASEKENTLVTEKLKLEKECKRLTDVLNSRLENIEIERVNQEIKTLDLFNKSVSEELRNKENEIRRLQQEFYDDKVKTELKNFEKINKKLLKENEDLKQKMKIILLS